MHWSLEETMTPVQFCSRYLCVWGNAYVLHHITQKFPQHCLWNRSSVGLIHDAPPPPPPPFFFFFFSKKTSGYFLYSSPLQLISDMLSLALCLPLVSQVPQHLRSCKMQAICDGYFAHQSICLVVSLDLGMSRTVHLHEFSIVSIEHTSVGFLFYFLL